MRSSGGNGGASATEGVADSGAGGGMDVGRAGMALAGMVGAGFGGLAVVGMASHREYLLEWVVAASDGWRMGASSLAPRRARRGVCGRQRGRRDAFGQRMDVHQTPPTMRRTPPTRERSTSASGERTTAPLSITLRTPPCHWRRANGKESGAVLGADRWLSLK